MINLEFNTAVKALGAKFNGSTWIAPELAQDEFNALNAKYNEDIVAVELTVSDDNRDRNAWLGTAHAVAIGGYVLATAYGRDSGAKLSPGIAVISGGFSSGGSAKNYRCCINGDSVRVRCKVAKAMLPELQAIEGIDLTIKEELQPVDKQQEEIQRAIKLLTANGYSVTKI